MNDNAARIEARRIGGLRRFAIAISVLNLFGHFVLGFEQSWATPLVALAAAYSTELLMDFVDAQISSRPLRFSGGILHKIDFF